MKHLWEHYYPHAAIGLGLLVAGFYLARLSGGAIVARTLHEYFSFICLIGSLFVVAGGIHLKVKGEATPRDNVVFLAIGAVAANLIGTTGASMVLIRPWIRMNKIRISAFHIVFFIFIVSNCGGALTPIGDPPLFLGYLRGVPFFWLLDHVIVAMAGHDRGDSRRVLRVRPPQLPACPAGHPGADQGARHVAVRGRRQLSCFCW